MDFSFTSEEEAFRREVRSFLDKELPAEYDIAVINPAEDRYRDGVWELQKVLARKFGEKGWLNLNWPEEYGGKGSIILSTIFQEEIHYRGAPGWDGFTVGMLAPTLIRFGTEQQKKEHLPPIARGERFWCEGFSEPEVGSDLASIRTSAREDGDRLIINGQKLWTSGAHKADWCFLLVRTNPSPPKKHMGITFLLLDMRTPGISVRTITDMGGGNNLCEVFLNDVVVPRGNILGQKDHGWEVAMTLLDFERGLDVGPIATMQRLFEMLVQYLKEQGKASDPLIRQRLADIEIEIQTARLLSHRGAWLASKGLPASVQVSMSKVFSFETQQRTANTAMKLLGSYGQLAKGSKWAVLQGIMERWYLETFAFTLFTGTSEIQRNIIATRGLEMPRG
ncbi:MAG: acyl-CoA dehydrogenase family protein [Dehalococcoidales bacterium]|nr:acyl-CoA dehydrogenase family protein [Dehalococcoidales bacterium]